MATDNLEQIVETLSNLKVVDLAKLKTLLEDKWGVTAAAPMAAMAMPAAKKVAPKIDPFPLFMEAMIQKSRFNKKQ